MPSARPRSTAIARIALSCRRGVRARRGLAAGLIRPDKSQPPDSWSRRQAGTARAVTCAPRCLLPHREERRRPGHPTWRSGGQPPTPAYRRGHATQRRAAWRRWLDLRPGHCRGGRLAWLDLLLLRQQGVSARRRGAVRRRCAHPRPSPSPVGRPLLRRGARRPRRRPRELHRRGAPRPRLHLRDDRARHAQRAGCAQR